MNLQTLLKLKMMSEFSYFPNISIQIAMKKFEYSCFKPNVWLVIQPQFIRFYGWKRDHDYSMM